MERCHGNATPGVILILTVAGLSAIQLVVGYRVSAAHITPDWMLVVSSLHHESWSHLGYNLLVFGPAAVSASRLARRTEFYRALAFGLWLPNAAEILYDLAFSIPSWVVGFSGLGYALFGLAVVSMARRASGWWHICALAIGVGLTGVLAYHAVMDGPMADVAHLVGWGVGIIAATPHES